MSRLRCFPTVPKVPGTLYLITLSLHVNSAPIQAVCMEEALDKWQRLFMTKVIHYSLEDSGAALLLYVPSRRLTNEEAKQRNHEFDQWLMDLWQKENDLMKARARQQGTKPRRRAKPRKHKLLPDQLNSPSEFMQLFKPDLRARHLYKERPTDLLPGITRVPVYRRRFTALVVQHTDLPPVFSPDQIEDIKKKLNDLGFENDATPCYDTTLCLSQHGIGTMEFLAELEEQCYIMLKARGKEPKLWDRFGHKYICPITQEALDRRLGELTLREKHEDYPMMQSMLQTLDGLTDKLGDPSKIFVETPMSNNRKNQILLACTPVRCAMLMTDGFLRWYYRNVEKVEFPKYDYYGRLLSWNLNHKSTKR